MENDKEKQSPVGAALDGALSAKAYERQKTREQRAEDIAYTINHSIYCTLTDFINPPINAVTDNWLRWLIPGCGHDHSGDAKGHDGSISVGHVHGSSCNHSPATHVHTSGCSHNEALEKHVHGPSCNHTKPLIPLSIISIGPP